jgi:putative oxidoreductase
MGFFTQHQHIPAPLAFLAICAEFFGGLGLIVGLLSRIAAFGILCNMVVAVLTVHAANGFFMNWTGQQKGEGFEYHLLAIALLLVVMVKGAGALSVDRALTVLPSDKKPPQRRRLMVWRSKLLRCRFGFCGFGLAGVGFRILAAEALDSTGGVHQLLLAGEERVACGADFHVDVALVGRTGQKRIAAGAMYFNCIVAGMDGCLHRNS